MAAGIGDERSDLDHGRLRVMGAPRDGREMPNLLSIRAALLHETPRRPNPYACSRQAPERYDASDRRAAHRWAAPASYWVGGS